MQPKQELEKLYLKKYENLCGYVSKKFGVSRDLAEDVVQESFFLAIKNLEQYDSKRGNLENWLYGIVKNTIFGNFRKYKSQSNLLEKLALSYQDSSYETMEESAMVKDVASKVKEDIDQNGLDRKTQKIISLWLRGSSKREIGKKVKLSKYMVKKTIDEQLDRWRELYGNV